MPLKQWIAKKLNAKPISNKAIRCPNCESAAQLVKVGPQGMAYRCGGCNAEIVKKSDQPYTEA
jgi:DNA-directed RNA polymerase subunit RPC12/RpoP